MAEDQMVRQHHKLNGHEFEQTLGDSGGQGSLACYSSWGGKESDMTQCLNNSNNKCSQNSACSVVTLPVFLVVIDKPGSLMAP